MERIFRCKRIIAVLMTYVVAFTFSMSGARMKAAEKQDVTYIKDFKLYIAENSKIVGTYDEGQESKKAKEWFEKNGYTMVEGNLNSEASGTLKKEVGVYLGYSTTTNSKEAVTDIAVMNERGNYSEGEYKRILEEQKKMYTDMVSDLKEMLEEYRANVNNNVPTALQAKEFMNGYVDPDSNQKLGDLLMTISDDNLGTILMQANGQVVLMMEDRLSYACDTGKTTWLDRMAKLGSYKALEKKALKACNNNITKARKTLDKKYKEDALTLAKNWEDIRQHINKVREQEKSWGLDKMDEKQAKDFFEKNADNSEVQAFLEKYQLTSVLAGYSYEGNTLFDYFEQPADTFAGDDIRKLYPLAASLSDGQISGVDQTVSLFTLVVNALGASAFNDYKTGETKEMMDKMDSEDESEMEETKGNVDKSLDNWKKIEPISIYEGVDRDVFDGGVAVTTTAKKFSNGDGKTWADALVNGWAGKTAAIGMAVGSALFATGAIIATKLIPQFKNIFAEGYFNAWANIAGYDIVDGGYTEVTAKWGNTQVNTLDAFNDYTQKQKNDIFDKAMLDMKSDEYEPNARNLSNLNLAKKLQIGFTVASIVLAVADIVVTSITLYKYYNRDHLPIPSCMVDLSYNEDGDTSFVNYKSVLDQNDKYGDVNGGGGKQWLALYQTHDDDAGKPILAPENGEEFGLIVQNGSAEEPKTEGYAPLHMFGTPNTPQNLTFADGESGWSYNDGKKGTYLFFCRGEAGAAGEGETASGSAVSGSSADVGTASGTGTVALVGALCGVGGIFVGAIGMGLIRRKKKTEEKQN